MLLFEILPEKIRFYVNILIYEIEYIFIHKLFDRGRVMTFPIILGSSLAFFDGVEYILELGIKPITRHIQLIGQTQ